MNFWNPKTWSRSHEEMRSVLRMENAIFDELEDVEVKRGEVRRRFEQWARDNSPETHELATILQDSYSDQREAYQEYFKKYNEFTSSVHKALQQEKFLDPLVKDVKRKQKAVNKAEKKYRKFRAKYDKTMTKRNWSLKERKYNQKLDLYNIKKSESERQRDTSQATLDREQQRINANMRKFVLEGYMTLLKQNYLLQRSEIVHHEQAFDRLREIFPDESARMDLPREKLTPILQLSQEQQEKLQREQYDREKAKQPKVSIQEAMEAALPSMPSGVQPQPKTSMGVEHTFQSLEQPTGVIGLQEQPKSSEISSGVGQGEQRDIGHRDVGKSEHMDVSQDQPKNVSGTTQQQAQVWTKKPFDMAAPPAPPLPRTPQLREAQRHHTAMSQPVY